MVRQQHKQRRDALVKRLFEEGKTRREIAQIARISLRDIGPILMESGLDYSFTMSSRAYGMYSDGKSPLEVAMALNIKEPDATKFHLEYLSLNLQNELLQIYYNNKDELLSIIKLHRFIRDAKIDKTNILRLLRIANADLPNLENKYNGLITEVEVLESRRLNLEAEIQSLHDRIISLSNELAQLVDSAQKEDEHLCRLYSERARLESAIKKFKDNNEIYLHVKKAVEERLSNRKILLRYSLLALADSIRNEPDKYAPLLFYDNHHALSTTISMSGYYEGYSYRREPNFSLNHSRNDYIDMLMDVSEKLLSLLTKAYIENIMTDSTEATSSSSLHILGDEAQKR